jgi:hypothetical protein
MSDDTSPRTREQAIRTLFRIWIFAPILPVLIMGLQTMNGKYGADADVAWSWLIGQVAPVISILIAAIFSDPADSWKTAPADNFRWRCAAWASAIQLTLMTAILLLEPLTPATPFQLFAMTAIPLTMLQGLVVAAVGAVIFHGR